MIDNSNIKYWKILRFYVVITRHEKIKIKKVDFRCGIMEKVCFFKFAVICNFINNLLSLMHLTKLNHRCFTQ